MHVNPQLKAKALVLLYNPLKEKIKRTITLPLYYTGLEKQATIKVNGINPQQYSLNRDYSINIKISIEPESFVWLTVE
jgi:hypothetical protein